MQGERCSPVELVVYWVQIRETPSKFKVRIQVKGIDKETNWGKVAV
jgi:hypothetical protein